MKTLAIETFELTKKYGNKIEAVKNLNLQVPTGSIYAFLGKNGAGKTTTIRMLLGFLRRTRGNITVVGFDPEKDSIAVRKKIGYVAENQRMYDWMTVNEIIEFCRAFYPSWDFSLQKQLMERSELSGSMRLKDLSTGTYEKVALLLAVCHQPELLILDDPTSGLDPVARREFMQGIIEAFQQREKTVFFSTHIVNEIEQIADWVGIIDKGVLIISQPLDKLKSLVKKIHIVFETDAPEINIPGIVWKEKNGREITLVLKDYSSEVLNIINQFKPIGLEVINLTLEEIFVSLVR